MNKTKIEWCDYTINPVKGLCPMACTYCYARRMYKRYKWDEAIRMEPDWQDELPKKPAKVFVGSTMELFGSWVEDWMMDDISSYVNGYPQHTFIFLTKRPAAMKAFQPFAENIWTGASVTNDQTFIEACTQFMGMESPLKFLSIEPLLGQLGLIHYIPLLLQSANIKWVIIGQQTPVSAKTNPKMEWIKEIVTAADKLKIPVFLKNNLLPLLDKAGCPQWAYETPLNWETHRRLRQELPL